MHSAVRAQPYTDAWLSTILRDPEKALAIAQWVYTEQKATNLCSSEHLEPMLIVVERIHKPAIVHRKQGSLIHYITIYIYFPLWQA